MEALYYISVRQQASGTHIIHIDDCPLLPDHGKTIFLGIFDSPEQAMKEGKDHFRKSEYCPFCLRHLYLKSKKHANTELYIAESYISYSQLIISWENAMLCGVN